MKKADFIFIAIILLVAIILFTIFMTGEKGATAVVTIDGKEVGRYPLSIDGTFPLNGGSNILVIENGEAYLSEANCPDKLCVKMGKISKTGQSVTCLPNKLNVRIEGAGDAEVDIIVG
jgi:Uncharacterized protein conserved in bacteria